MEIRNIKGQDDLPKSDQASFKSTSNGRDTVKKYVSQLMHSEIPPERANQVYSEKVERSILTLDFSDRQKAQKKEKQQHLERSVTMGSKIVKQSSRERKNRLGLARLEPRARRFEVFLPLHQLWKGYMEELWGSTSERVFASKLLKADFHGSFLTVTKSKIPSQIGTRGIVIQETTNTFVVVTQKNQCKVLPKENQVFGIEIRDKLFLLYGNQIKYNSAERAAKKFKSKPSIDL